MDKSAVSVSAFDCYVLRSGFIVSVIDEGIPEDQWRERAAFLITDFTGNDDIDSDLLDWIVGVTKLPSQSGNGGRQLK